MKFRYSIVTRFALFFTGLLIFCILLTGYLVFRKASDVIVDYSQERIRHTSEMAEQSFFALLNEVSNDIAIIANSPTLQNYVYSQSDKTVSDLNSLFRITLENKKSYFQIRLIGIKDNGRELVRFDKENNRIFSPDTLQQKGNLDYFKETIKLDQGDFYFSKINLNEEYGVISTPPTPTLRAASPIFNSTGSPIGIIIINVDMGQLYQTLGQLSGRESQLYLIDDSGQYLYAPEVEKRFSNQTKNNHNFFSDFRVPQDTMLSQEYYFGRLTDLHQNVYLSNFKKLSYFKGQHEIYLISSIEQNVLLQGAHAVRSESIQTLFWVCIFSILMSLLFVNFFSKKIDQVTRAIDNYNKGISEEMELPTD
ncbi:MAG: cache domain-containing protein, partial [Pricia sp.]|nr:cache domain-containing protein [Pricia sp.]